MPTSYCPGHADTIIDPNEDLGPISPTAPASGGQTVGPGYLSPSGNQSPGGGSGAAISRGPGQD